MSKTVVVVIVIVLIILGGGYFLSQSATQTTTTPTPTPSPSATLSTTVSATQSSSDNVTIQSFAFTQPSITVKKGTTVTWTNEDSVGHTVTETDSQTGPASSTLATGDTYSFTYNTVGTFPYHCSIHSSMTGSVTVTE